MLGTSVEQVQAVYRRVHLPEWYRRHIYRVVLLPPWYREYYAPHIPRFLPKNGPYTGNILPLFSQRMGLKRATFSLISPKERVLNGQHSP